MTSQGESATNPADPPLPAAAVSKRKRVRAGYRAYVTKLITDAKTLSDEEPFAEVRADQLKFLLKERVTLLRKIDEEIFDLIPEDEIEREVIESEEIQSHIYSVIFELDSRQRNLVEPAPTASIVQPLPSQPSTSQYAADMPNLPKLHLPKFYGDPKKWQEWWDSYEIIHGNPNLSDINKFRHLRTLLEGPAATAVSGIQTTSLNYSEAIAILKDRFANKQIIINSHMESLLNLNQVSNERDIKNLRKLHDNIETNVRSLKTLGVDFAQYGALLVPMIMSKFPEDIRLAITKSVNNDWGLDSILAVFKTELNAREQCQVKFDVKNSGVQNVVKPRGQLPTTTALFSNDGKVTCTFSRMLFDSGSQKSYISAELRDALNLPTISKETLTIKTFGSERGAINSYDVTQFGVRSPYNGVTTYVTAYVVPTVCAPLKNQVIDLAASVYPHLNGLSLADYPANNEDELSIQILIGSDFYWNFMTGGVVRSQSGGPIALESVLGWILSGPVPVFNESTSTGTNFAQTHVLRVNDERPSINCNSAVERELAKFWELESLGISPKEESVYEHFSDEIRFVDGRYEVKLPWKLKHPPLPDNYLLAKKRLEKQMPKLQSNPELLKEYNAIMKDQEERGIIERVHPNTKGVVGKTHFLPHHPVVRQDKETTKVRIVYDASAANSSGVSLNSCLYQGPCLLRTVAEILTRFRLFPIGLTSDIEKAFLMISINEADRDSLRFLWYENVQAEERNLQVYRFCRVVFGVTCSPFLLNATLSHHIRKYQDENPIICTKLLSALYADDVTSGGYSVEDVFQLFLQSKQIMSDGGFNLRKWKCNSYEVMQKITEAENQSQSNAANLHINEDEQSYAKSTVGKDVKAEDAEQKDTWPNDKCIRNVPEECLLEMKEADRNDSFALHSQVEKYPNVSSIIDCDRFSSYSKLLRVTSYVFRFIKNCRSKDKNIDELNSDELNEAECAWIRDMQSCIPKKKLKDLELHIGKPIQKLYPLELSTPESGNVSTNPEAEGLPDSADNKSIRPKRTAAIMARERWNIIDQLQKEQFD
eukprot:gene6856-12454_t